MKDCLSLASHDPPEDRDPPEIKAIVKGGTKGKALPKAAPTIHASRQGPSSSDFPPPPYLSVTPTCGNNQRRTPIVPQQGAITYGRSLNCIVV